MQHQPRQVVTNSPDQQARRASLQPSIGYALRQLGQDASDSAVGPASAPCLLRKHLS